MDKKSLTIGIVLLLLAFFWPVILNVIWPPPSPAEKAQQQHSDLAENPQQPQNPVTSSGAEITAPPVQSALDVFARKFLDTPAAATLENASISVAFTPVGAGIRSVTLKNHESENGERVILNRDGTAPILAIVGWDDGSADLASIRAQRAGNAVRFTYSSPEGLEVMKLFELQEGEKTFQSVASITLRNPTDRTVTIPTFYLNVGTSGPIHRGDVPYHIGFDYGGPRGVYHKKITDFREGFFGMRPARQIIEEVLPINWLTSRNQYFLTFLRKQGKDIFEGFRAVDVKMPPYPDGARADGVQTLARMPLLTLAPGEAVTWKFDLYTGPREYGLLRALGDRAQLIMEYGWFGLVSVFLGWLMITFHSLVQSYGLAIILMVLVVRAILWPLQSQANKAMKSMQALAPKMKEIQSKYKDNPQKMNEEIMALYGEYGVNPLGGCLPVLVQIPVFFGFYAMLQSAVQLRYESFLWIKDLSAPDTLFVIPGINFPINLLPILMGATSLWQMNITPMTTTDKFQATLFKIMPLIFVVVCYNFSSALALYWTVQNLVGVVQLYYNLSKPPPKLVKKNKPKGRWQLMMEQARILAEEERKKKLARKK